MPVLLKDISAQKRLEGGEVVAGGVTARLVSAWLLPSTGQNCSSHPNAPL